MRYNAVLMHLPTDYTLYLDQLIPLLTEVATVNDWGPKDLASLLNKFPKPDSGIFSKEILIQAYRELAGKHGIPAYEERIVQRMQMKPTRTGSGVTPVTVLTKPFPCPGKCIFCPNDIRMPKSYLSDEPGAQRAERNSFDPYLQTYNRLQAYQNIGHQIDKVELIVLGGTWSYYPEAYQIWFVKECFRALNDFGEQVDNRSRIEEYYREMREKLLNVTTAVVNRPVPGNNPVINKTAMAAYQVHGGELDKSYNQTVSEMYVAPERIGGFDQYQTATWAELEIQQHRNEIAHSRNVGLVIETRPDNISEAEVLRIRRLGCTKTQIGFQSLQDSVLTLNKRGHDVAATRRAVNLLRQAGFKIHAHWMPNLYGSSVELDQTDYQVLFEDPDFKPDELKIYPCSLIESAELMQYYQRGEWRPYTEAELLDVLTFCLTHTPEYTRLTRVIRDIPSTDIVVGNKKTNFREIAEKKLRELGETSVDIRAREIKNQQVELADLELRVVRYETSVSHELFLQYVVKADSDADSDTDSQFENKPKIKSENPHAKIAGFLRLSFPTLPNFIGELKDKAIIREVHVYGQTVALGIKTEGKAQHLGLGHRLITEAARLASEAGFNELAVISAIGTREYYRKEGFDDGELYQFLKISSN